MTSINDIEIVTVETTKTIESDDKKPTRDPESYVKLTLKNYVHGEVKYKEGLNVDPIKFNPIKKCKRGGLYFCRYKDVGRWFRYAKKTMYWIWDVTLPDGEEVIDMGTKLKAHRIILTNKSHVHDDEFILKEAIEYRGLNLKHIKEQTLELCQLAVERNPRTIKHAQYQTEDMCVRAVNEDPTLIKYVKHQTEKMCETAVTNKAHLFEYVDSKFHTEKICIRALRWRPSFIKNIAKPTKKMCMKAVGKSGIVLEFIPSEMKTDDVCIAAVKQNYKAIEFVGNQTKELCMIALDHTKFAMKLIKEKYKTDAVLAYAAMLYGLTLVDKDHSESVCKSLLEHKSSMLNKLKPKSDMILHITLKNGYKAEVKLTKDISDDSLSITKRLDEHEE
jgi:hypothetical protein